MDHPLRRGLHAAIAVAPAGAVLIAVAVAILAGYDTIPPVTRALDVLAQFKLRGGLLFAAVSTAIFAALIPIVIQQSMRRTRTGPGWRKLPWLTAVWAIKGVEVDLLYRGEAWLFGDNAAIGTILCKLVFDQFIYCPLWAVPMTVLVYTLLDRQVGPRAFFGRGWYARRIVPVLIANWLVWIPATGVIYSLKLPLQLPMQNLVLCLWSILMLVMVHTPVTRLRQEL